ncbi:MAG: heavy metal sensor histidine kinase [Thermoanaerobaculia bacterium]
MSSKLDEPSRDARALSITARLVILFTVAILGMLGVSSLIAWRALRVGFDTQDQEFIRQKISVLREILSREIQPAPALRPEIDLDPNVHNVTRYWIRIEDARGNVVMQTRGMEMIVPDESVFPRPAPPGVEPSSGILWRDAHGVPYMISTAKAAGIGEGPYVIRLMLEKADDEEVMKRFGTSLAVVILIGSLLAIPIAVVLVRRGMTPLREIAATVEGISASRLEERIGDRPWPSEVASLARSFDSMLERLEDSFGRLSQFSADLAHELRTPLNNLMGELEVTLQKERTPEEYREILQSNLEEGVRLTSMIESLLFVARAEATQGIVNTRPLDARKEVDAVIEFFEAFGEQKQISLLAEGSATVAADPLLLRRALTNLVSNALNHTTAGDRIVIRSREREGHVLISVEDTGSGIAPEHLPKLFDRFYRADAARSGHGGTGLGLAIVRSIMRLHSGDVRIASEPGEGTVVTLDFPQPSAGERRAATVE